MNSGYSTPVHEISVKGLAQDIVEEMKKLEAGGLFEDSANISNLWDEACWAINEGSDELAEEAAIDTIEQFSNGIVTEFIKNLERLLNGTGDAEPEGLSINGEKLDLLTEAVIEEIRNIIYHRDYSELELVDCDEDDEDDLEISPNSTEVIATWMLSKNDADALLHLRDRIWSMRRSAHSGNELLAISAVVATLEAILDREEFRCGVGLSWTDRPEMMEGRSASITVWDEGIDLSIMEFVPTGQGRSCDHGSILDVHLDEDGSFDTDRMSRWIEIAVAVSGGAQGLSTEINWLPEF